MTDDTYTIEIRLTKNGQVEQMVTLPLEVTHPVEIGFGQAEYGEGGYGGDQTDESG